MSYTFYDNFLAPQLDRGSFNVSSAPGAIFYPDRNQVNVMGGLYVPRVYGRDLSALEIGSSGLVAISLKDIHSLDMDRDVAASNVSLKTQKQDSLEFGVNSDRMGLKFSSANDSNNVTLYTDSNILISACNDITVLSQDFAQTNSGNYSLDASNITMIGANKSQLHGQVAAFVSSSNAEVRVTPSNVSVSASNQYQLQSMIASISHASGAYTQSVNSSGKSVIVSQHDLEATASNISETASNINLESHVMLDMHSLQNAKLCADDTLDLCADSTMNLFAPTFALSSSNASVTCSNATLSSAVSLSSTAPLTTVSASNAVVSVSHMLDMHSLENAKLCADDTLDLCADSTMNLFAPTFALSSSNASVTCSNATLSSAVSLSSTAPLTTVSASNAVVSVSHMLDMHSLQNAKLCADNQLDLCADVKMVVDAPTMEFTSTTTSMTASQSVAVACPTATVSTTNTTFTSTQNISSSASNYLVNASNVSLSAINDMSLSGKNIFYNFENFNNSANNIGLSGDGANVSLGGSTIELSSSSNLSLSSSNVNVTGSNIEIFGALDACLKSVNAEVCVSPSDIKATSSNTVQVQSGGIMSFTASHNLVQQTSSNLQSSATQNVTVTAGKDVSLSADSNVYVKAYDNAMFVSMTKEADSHIITGKATAHKWFSGSSEKVVIDSEGLTVRGNIKVEGVVDSIAVTQSNLNVKDTTISLADGATADGAQNDGSGIKIKGGAADKSFTWHNNQGTQYLGTSDLDKNSYWELKGGAFHMSQNVPNMGDISFGFRINEMGEFELIKKLPSGEYKRVAKFGRSLL